MDKTYMREAPALLITIVLNTFEVFSMLELSSLSPPFDESEDDWDDCLLIGSRVILIPCYIYTLVLLSSLFVSYSSLNAIFLLVFFFPIISILYKRWEAYREWG